MSLPNPAMDAVPLTPLTAEFLDDIIENIEALADGTGADAASIDVSKFNNPYSFHAYRSASQTVTSNTKITLNTEVWDTGGNFNTTTSQFTVPVTGYYQLNASMHIQINTNANTAFGMAIFLNNVTVLVKNEDVNMYAGAYIIHKPASTVAKLTAGDTIQLYCTAASLGGNSVTAGQYANFLNGYLTNIV